MPTGTLTRASPLTRNTNPVYLAPSSWFMRKPNPNGMSPPVWEIAWMMSVTIGKFGTVTGGGGATSAEIAVIDPNSELETGHPAC